VTSDEYQMTITNLARLIKKQGNEKIVLSNCYLIDIS